MVAQRLARHCGLDFAIMSGGDVVRLGRGKGGVVGSLRLQVVWSHQLFSHQRVCFGVARVQ